jgi:ubiquinone/menaquinone biosynthesis C-methylase UbiE
MTEILTTHTAGFEQHPIRGRFNAAFFGGMDAYIERKLGPHKQRVFTGLPQEVVEIGSGTGANLRYLPEGGILTAVEPNRYMHDPLQKAASRHGIELRLHETLADDTGLPDDSADAVISSLVLCTVADPRATLAEIRRILRPGGSFRFVEHVVAPDGSATRAAQRLLRRPWAFTFEGCSCERDLEQVVRHAGFESVSIERYRISSPFVPFNTQIAGIARA